MELESANSRLRRIASTSWRDFPKLPADENKHSISSNHICCSSALRSRQNTQAVSPAPDGAYSGANTAEGGSGTLFSLTTGTNNTALGSQALFSLTTGSQNTATGAQALKNNTADQNTADGFQALVRNTTGGPTRLLVGERSLKTRSASATRPTVTVRSISTPWRRKHGQR